MNKLCCLIIIFITCGVCKAQNVTGFFATFGSSSLGPPSIVQADSGNFIISATVGYGQNADILTAKVSADGNVLWAKQIGLPNSYQSCRASCKTANGNILLGGESITPGVAVGSYLVEIDTAGNLVRTRSFLDGSEISSMVKTSDNGYAVTGHYFDFPDEYIMIARFDSSLNMLWQKIGYYQFDDTEGNSIIQTSDGGLAITGYQNGPGGFLSEFFIKLDSSGNTQWFNTIGYANQIHERGTAIIQNANGSYIIAGVAQTGTTCCYKTFLTKFDSSGTLLWAKTFADTASYNALMNTGDGGYVVSSFSTGQYLLKYDMNDSLQWSTHDMGGYSNGTCMVETNEHGILSTGLYNGYGFISKTDSLGVNCRMVPHNFTYTLSVPAVSPDSIFDVPNAVIDSGGVMTVISMPSAILCTSVSAPEVVDIKGAISIYPNPVADNLNITNNNNELSEIIIYDIASRVLLQQTFTNAVTLNTSQLAKGIYLYIVRNKDGVIKKGKIVKD